MAGELTSRRLLQGLGVVQGQGGTPPPAPTANYIASEDGSHFLLEDGSGSILMEA